MNVTATTEHDSAPESPASSHQSATADPNDTESEKHHEEINEFVQFVNAEMSKLGHRVPVFGSDTKSTQPDATDFERQGSATMRLLENLNAEAARSVYKPLSSEEIRLVKIHAGAGDDHIRCSLLVVQEDPVPKYEALSYVWGSQNCPKTILLNGTLWDVTQNLYKALFQLRQADRDRVVWIDALAINQSDIPERNAQVSKMATIYSLASNTVVWLGLPKSDELIYWLELLTKLSSFNPPLLEKGIESLGILEQISLITILAQISSEGYWRRVWVVQEIMYSRHALVMYGSWSMSYSRLAELISTTLRALLNAWTFDPAHFETHVVLSTLQAAGPLSLPACGSARHGKYLDINEWQAAIRSKEATDPRDRLFAYASCFSPEIRELVKIDYSKDLKQVVIEMTQLLLRDPSKLGDILESSNYDDLSTVPSWVWAPWLSAEEKSSAPYPRCHAAGKSPGFFAFVDHSDILHVRGKTAFVVSATASPMYPDYIEDTVKLVKGGLPVQTIPDHFLHVWKMLSESQDSSEARWWFAAAYLTSATHTDATDISTFDQYVLWLEDQKFKPQYTEQVGFDIAFGHVNRRMFSCILYLPPEANKSNADLGTTVTYGLGPVDILPGDRICAIFGCSTAIILRQFQDYYTLVGSAYVPVMMDGEVVKNVESGKEEPDDFYVR